MEAPTVSPYDWIYVGQLRAVVCTVRSKDRVEIVRCGTVRHGSLPAQDRLAVTRTRTIAWQAS
jgi:hypothetical protein